MKRIAAWIGNLRTWQKVAILILVALYPVSFALASLGLGVDIGSDSATPPPTWEATTNPPTTTKAPTLDDQIDVNIEACYRLGGADGTVTNNSNMTVDVWVTVQYLDEAGIIIEDGLDGIDKIRPGETATWEDRVVEPVTISQCRTSVDAYKS